MSAADSSPGNNGGGGRVRSLSAAASGAVRAGTVIGSVGRAVEELVRNAASASAATVTVVVGSGGGGGAGSGSGSSSSSSSSLPSQSSSIITVHDDGRGIDPRSLQKYVGTDHCSSWGAASSSSSSSSSSRAGLGAGAGGRGNWQAAASVGLFAERGESLRSIAALAVEMRIASSSSVGIGEEEEEEEEEANGGAVSGTSAAFAGEENRRQSLPAMAEGEKKRRTAAAHHHHHQAHSQQQQQQQQQVVVRCEKVLREGRAVSFSSSSSSATGTGRTWDDAGTSVHASSGGGDADGSSILPPALLVGAATTSGIRDVTAVGGKRSRSSFGGTSSKGAYLYNRSLQQQQQQTTGTAITVVGLFHRYAVRRRHQERTTGVGGGNGGVNGGANRSSSRTATAAAASADLSQARICLRSMALAYPLLAFRLIDGRTGTVDSSWDGVAAAAPARNGDARSTSRPRFDPSLPLTANFSAQRDTSINSSSSSSHLSLFQNDNVADDNTAGNLVDSRSRRFRQHCGEAALRNHRLVGMVYDEEVESTSSHSNMSCNSNSSSVALPRRRRSARLPWSVVGVLCIGTATDDNSNNNNPLDDVNTRTEQLQQQQQKKKADRAIIKSRQHELVFINKRPARYNNVLAAIVQDEISTFLPLQEDGQPPSSSSFVVHATVAPRDVDLIIDENRSSLAVPQRERMERLLRRAVASTMKNNGYTRRRASQQSDRGLSSRRRRGHHPQQQSQMRNSSRHHHSRGGRSAFDPSSVLGSISTNSDSTAFASVGSIASSKVISGEAVFKSSSSALPSSPYFSTSSSRSGGDSSSNADVDTDKPSSASPFTDAFFGSQPMTDLERKSPAVCFEEAFLSTGPTNNGVTIEGSEPSDNDENDPPAEEDHSLDVTNTSWTRTRLRALENQISSLVVDPGQGSRGAAPSMTLSKEMLSKAEVIAQLDEKYVLIKAGGLLCVVDQHAADERVSLERLERRLLTEIQDGAGAHTEGGNNRGAPLMRSVSLLPAQAISLSPSQLAVVQHNTDLLEQWRFSVELPSNPHEPLLLKGVPGIGDKVAKKGDFLQYLQALESRSSDAALVTPAFIKRTIASNACRYSIMFGDHLSSEQMENLIGSLSKCDLPFICAHGRPSVIPLLSLKGLDDE